MKHISTPFVLLFALIGPLLSSAANLAWERTGTESGLQALVTPNASVQAREVFAFLQKNYGRNILSGTMASPDYNTKEAEWVFRHTGKYPAFNCVDYMHKGRDGVDYNDTSMPEEWWNNGGLFGACWHWFVPLSESDRREAFYVGRAAGNRPGTTFSIANAVKEGTWEHKRAVADMEEVAGYLLLLQGKGIPVIWRPLHEAAGGWFWWGAEGPAPCKALWRMMFNLFKEKGLNNLIWVWTVEPNDNEWYPGDEYVDIVSRDLYRQPEAKGIYDNFMDVANRYHGKMITLSEFGGAAKISEQWNAGAKWSWFMPWYDIRRTGNTSSEAFGESQHGHADVSWWLDAVGCDFVITRDEMPDLR